MSQVCENCGWRTNINNEKGCIFTNNKKKKIWKRSEYNQPCQKYVMDTLLKEHLKSLL